MGVQLNIKDAETVELARGLAEKLGKSVTETIRDALRKEAAARDADIAERIRQINEVVAEFQRHIPDEWRGRSSKEWMDDIYDEDGLPR